MTTTVCYILVALLIAPALVAAGKFDLLAVHLFALYYGNLAHITPPVAMAAFVAAPIAGANAMKIGLRAMRLGIMLFILPFVFVLQPALILHGPPQSIIYAVGTALAGLVLVAAAIEGYLVGVGATPSALRLPLVVAGVLLFVPVWQAQIIGAAIGLLTVGLCRLAVRRRQPSFIS